jgi:hypothetical protein
VRFNFLGGWLTSENDGEVEARLDILGNSGRYLLFGACLKSLLSFLQNTKLRRYKEKTLCLRS